MNRNIMMLATKVSSGMPSVNEEKIGLLSQIGTATAVVMNPTNRCGRIPLNNLARLSWIIESSALEAASTCFHIGSEDEALNASDLESSC